LAALAKIDAAQSELANQAEIMLDTMSDIIHGLRDYLEEIEFNPKRLEEVEERLDLIHSLTRKYGGNIPAVIATEPMPASSSKPSLALQTASMNWKCRKPNCLRNLASKATR
jgi:DNA repair ATPase RecN